MKKAVIYTRVSSLQQAQEGISLENQFHLLKAYCEFNQFDVVECISDEGISGFKNNRPGFVRIMQMVENREIEVVIVHALARFARNTELTLRSIDTMIKNGVEFHSITEKIDTGSAMGKFFITVMAALAELERNQVGERTKSVLDRKRENGEALGSIPYGYRKEDKMLVEDEYEQYVIKAILKWHDEGKGYGEIQRLCECNELRSRSGKWHRQTIKNIVEANLVR